MIKKILVKKDLYSYFVSPYFYICSLILYLTCCTQFFIFQRFFVSGFGTSNLTGFFTSIPYAFSLIIPVLILQISNPECEETFPFLSGSIILSKLVSTLIVIAVMLVPLVPVPFFVARFGNVEAGQTACSFLGIILHGTLSVSICLFCREIIPSKAAYTAVTVVILAMTNSFHLVPLYVNCGSFLTGFFNSVSFLWHFDSFSKGIIDTRDLFFYLITACLFSFAALCAAEFKKGRRFFSGGNALCSVLTVFIFLFLYIDSARIYTRFDFTKEKQFSVSPYTKSILNQAEEPVRITYYRSKELVSRYPEVKDVYDYLKICAGENKNISLSVLDADKAENQSVLTNLGVLPQQIQSVNNNRAEYIKVYSAVVIEYLGMQEVLPFVLSTASLEFELSLRFESLIKNKHHAVYLLCGNEYTPDDFSYFQQLLVSSSIRCYPLEKESLLQMLPQFDLSIPLVIFGTNALTEEQSAAVENFILKGGKALVATSRYSVNINGNWNVTKNDGDTFIPALEHWGIIFEDKLVNDLSNVRISFFSTQDGSSALNETTQYEYVNYPQWVSVLPQTHAKNGLTLFWASPVLETEKIIPLCYSSPMSWTVREFEKSVQSQTNQLYVTNPFEVEKSPIADPLFEKEQSVLAAKLNGEISGLYNFGTNENPSLIVIPDQYIALNILLELASGQISDFRNLDFLISMVLELNGETELLNMQYGGMKNTSLYKITDGIEFEKTKSAVSVMVFAVIPVCIILSGIAIFILRRIHNEKYKRH